MTRRVWTRSLLLGCFALLTVLVAQPVRAIPQLINYQGFLTNASGTPVNGTVSMVFSIFTVSSGGSAVWTETQSSVSVTNGVFNAILGSVTTLPTTVFTGTDTNYLQLAVGGETLTPRSRITSAGYAIKAHQATSATSASTASSAASTGSTAAFTADNNSTGNAIEAYVHGGGGVALVGYGNYPTTVPLGVVGDASYGLWGIGAPNGTAIFGETNLGSGTTSGGIGVAGRAESSTNGSAVGIYGAPFSSTTESGLSANWTAPTRNVGVFGRGYDIGVYGNASISGAQLGGVYGVGFYGVRGASSNTTGTGVIGIASASTGTNYGVYGQATSTSGYAGYFSGRLHATGALSKGSGTFVQPHAANPSKEIHYAFVEGPEHAVFIRGSAQLRGGRAEIELPEHFRIVAAAEGLQAQVTLLEDCNGVYVSALSRDRMEVRELANGGSSARFSYFITAVRDGFQGHQPVVDNTNFRPNHGESAKQFEQRYAGNDMTLKAMRNMMIASGIMTPEGKLNRETMEQLGFAVANEAAPEGRQPVANR